MLQNVLIGWRHLNGLNVAYESDIFTQNQREFTSLVLCHRCDVYELRNFIILENNLFTFLI